MTNEDIIQQLMFRSDRIKELLDVDQSDDAKDLLKSERAYVEETIRYRRKHGNILINTP